MCFGHENLGEDVCTRWDGENQTVVQQRSTKYHDWSSMINYQDQLMTVGGCGSIIDCNNMVEFYTEEGGWKTGANFPRWEIYGHTLTTDGAGIYLFGGKVRGAVNSQVYRLLDGEVKNKLYLRVSTTIGSGHVLSRDPNFFCYLGNSDSKSFFRSKISYPVPEIWRFL